MIREAKKGKVNKRVLNVIASNYAKLMIRCGVDKRGCFCSKSYEDIFEDTVLFVARDKKAAQLSDKEILNWFCYRFKMIKFQTINDNKILREVNYADNLQAKKD